MAQYEHKGFAITLTENGERFATRINSKAVSSSSLAGIKKMIDKSLTSTFTSFVGIKLRENDGDYARGVPPSVKTIKQTVIGIASPKKNDRYGFMGDKFVLAEDDDGTYSVIVDNEETRAKVEAYIERYINAHSYINTVLKELDEARTALPWVNPENYK